MSSDATAWLELLPPDTLRAVLSLLSADDLSSVGATNSAIKLAADSDALWQPHASQMPYWQRCGNPLPSQPGGRWSSFRAICRAACSRCSHCACTIDAPTPAGGVLAPTHPSRRPWRVSWQALDRARSLANVALEACVADILATVARMEIDEDTGTRLAVAVWLTRHDAVTGSTAGIGARCWLRRSPPVAPAQREAWLAELSSCADLPRAPTAPPGWVAAVGPAHGRQLEPSNWPPSRSERSLQLDPHEWAALERWAVGHQDPEHDIPRTGPLSSRRALQTRAAALAFAEQLVAGKCLLVFELICDYEVEADAVMLRRETLSAWHLPSHDEVNIA